MRPPTSRVAGRHCSQSGNMIHMSLSSLQLPTTVQCIQDTPGSPPQRTTSCWCRNSSRRPHHVACITVQLITVSKCPVCPSLYSRRLRLSCLSRVIAIKLVPDRKWSPRIPGDLIAIKCWSRQALHWLRQWGFHMQDTAIDGEKSHFRRPHSHLTPAKWANPDEYRHRAWW